MTEAEEQELFARVEKLERSARRWRWLASVLAVLFLALGSLGLATSVALRNGAVRRQLGAELRHREERDQAGRRADGPETVAPACGERLTAESPCQGSLLQRIRCHLIPDSQRTCSDGKIGDREPGRIPCRRTDNDEGRTFVGHRLR
jgi:hypothetical protein